MNALTVLSDIGAGLGTLLPTLVLLEHTPTSLTLVRAQEVVTAPRVLLVTTVLLPLMIHLNALPGTTLMMEQAHAPHVKQDTTVHPTQPLRMPCMPLTSVVLECTVLLA